jgi:hypothetical protein
LKDATAWKSILAWAANEAARLARRQARRAAASSKATQTGFNGIDDSGAASSDVSLQ